jgi:hypothetical protein
VPTDAEDLSVLALLDVREFLRARLGADFSTVYGDDSVESLRAFTVVAQEPFPPVSSPISRHQSTQVDRDDVLDQLISRYVAAPEPPRRRSSSILDLVLDAVSFRR